jgi:phosphoribosylglycinamide formyltransferase 2
VFHVDTTALSVPDTALRLFGKPEVAGHRRLGVALARGATLDEARTRAAAVARGVRVELG